MVVRFGRVVRRRGCVWSVLLARWFFLRLGSWVIKFLGFEVCFRCFERIARELRGEIFRVGRGSVYREGRLGR